MPTRAGSRSDFTHQRYACSHETTV